MWKDYSADYIKNNHSSSLSVRISAFISALLLSLLCGLFYNAWKYEVERIELEEGSWQSRIVGKLDEEDMEFIKNFATIEAVSRNEKESRGQETAVDLYFKEYKTVLSDTPRIAELVGVSPEAIVYHYELLAMYLIRDGKDRAPRLLFPMFLLVVFMASLSLIILIHNSFAVSMNARIHQFGIFSSIGATPKQIRSCLLQEAAALCAVPVLAGNLLGIAGSMGLIHMTNLVLGSDIPGRHKSVFGYHPMVFALTFLITGFTIWISAWLPARQLSKQTPLEAMKNMGERKLKPRKNSWILLRVFGVEGELAGNALKAQKKALWTASISFVLSFLEFIVMQSFFALSGISTKETYFERYQSVWDLMVTVKDVGIDGFEETEEIQGLDGVKSAIVYQKAKAKRIVTEEEMSEKMKSFGGFSHAPDKDVTPVSNGWMVNAPIILLDDNSFLEYCQQTGIAPRLDGAVVINQIRDVTNPDFRHPDFMPYMKTDRAGESGASVLMRSDGEEMMAKIPVLAYIDQENVPALREEYATLDYYELVHFIPVSLWKEIKGQAEGVEEEVYICVLGKENRGTKELDALEGEIDQILGRKYTIECENRIREYEANNKQIQGMKAILGGFCMLLAVIGIGNVFSNTLGFVYQRRREFARYMSVGMTPGEIQKMFCLEALLLGGRPILAGFLLAIAAVGYMLKLSYIEVGEFMAEAPWIPVFMFMAVMTGAVALAYFVAWRDVRKINLAQVLRDDTMM